MKEIHKLKLTSIFLFGEILSLVDLKNQCDSYQGFLWNVLQLLLDFEILFFLNLIFRQ
jgi:hypothetical protein